MDREPFDLTFMMAPDMFSANEEGPNKAIRVDVVITPGDGGPYGVGEGPEVRVVKVRDHTGAEIAPKVCWEAALRECALDAAVDEGRDLGWPEEDLDEAPFIEGDEEDEEGA